MIRKIVNKMYHVWSGFSRRQQQFVMAGVFLVTLATLWHVGSGIASAQMDNPDVSIFSFDFWLGLIAQLLLAIARLFLSITMFLLTFIIQIAGYNGYLNASAVNVGWVMVRDITNMGFVIVLLVIAFGTMLGVEHYEWKKMLVKMVMAAVLVNFSRTICGLLIDVSQVVMTTFLNGIAATAGGNLIRMFNLDTIRDLSASADPTHFTSSNFMIASIAAVFFSAMVMGVLAAFMIMLVARMVVLWVLIVLSPLAFVLSVLHQTEHYASEWWHKFTANLITGPVLLFFLWLAFVSVGNGRVVENDISQHNSMTVNAGQTDEAALLNGKSSGIGQALDWNSMANFIIAFGMLVIGAHTASELGGVGGSWASQGLDFGKKVAMYGSGAMLGRWAVGKAGEGAAAAGNKMLKPFNRLVDTVKHTAAYGLGKSAELRNEKAAAIEESGKLLKKLKEGKTLTEDEQKKLDKAGVLAGTGAVGRWISSRVIETGGRADKRVEDLEKTAHAQQVIVEETYSTSKSWQGRLKMDVSAREHQIKEFAAAKRDEKYAAKERELMGYDEKEGKFDHDKADQRFMEREKVILAAQAKTTAAKSDIESHKLEGKLKAERKAEVAEKEAGLKAARAGYEEEKINDTLEGERKAGLAQSEAALEKAKIEEQTVREKRKLAAQQDAGVFKTQAQAEAVKVELDTERMNSTHQSQKSEGVFKAKARAEHEQIVTTQQRELDVAAARDAILVELKRAGEATNFQRTRDRQTKSKIEAQVVGDFQVADARYMQQVDRMIEADASRDPEMAKQVRQAGLMMTIGNMDRHAAYTVNIQSNALKKMQAKGIPVSLEASMAKDAGAMENNIAQFLSYALGKQVTAANMENEFNQIPEELQFALYSAAEKAAGEGAVGLAGMMKVGTDSNGNPKVKLTKMRDDAGNEIEANIKYVMDRRTNALSGSRLTNMVGLSGSVDKNTSGKAVVESNEAKEVFVKLMASQTSNQLSSVNEFSILDIAQVFDNSNGTNLNSIVEDLVRKSVDLKGALGLMREASSRMENAQKKQVMDQIVTYLTQHGETIRKGKAPEKGEVMPKFN